MNQTIAAVWFDLDDTLFDHTYAVCCGLDAVRLVCHLGGRPARELAVHYNWALNSVYPAHLRGEFGFAEMRRRKLGLFYESIGVSAREALPMEEFHRIYDMAYGTGRRATEGSVEVLANLKGLGISLSILTNGKQADQEQKLRDIGLELMIPNLMTSEEAGATKPDAKIYRWALERTGQIAENVLMVGDNFENDVEAALGSGLKAGYYAPGSCCDTVSTAHGPAPVIRQWHELIDLLNRCPE